MPKYTPEDLEDIRRIRGEDSPLSTAGRYIGRAGRLAGLGVGTAIGANPLFAPLHLAPVVKDWLPDIERTPQAAKAFWDQASQGDWDAAIEAYQDELDAGTGYWGASELAASVIPTGGPFLAGGKLISSAPKLAQTISRVAPAASRARVAEQFVEPALRKTGQAMRLPWQAEEAVMKTAIAPLIAGARGIGSGVKAARARFADEAVDTRAVVVEQVEQVLVVELVLVEFESPTLPLIVVQ